MAFIHTPNHIIIQDERAFFELQNNVRLRPKGGTPVSSLVYEMGSRSSRQTSIATTLLWSRRNNFEFEGSTKNRKRRSPAVLLFCSACSVRRRLDKNVRTSLGCSSCHSNTTQHKKNPYTYSYPTPVGDRTTKGKPP